MFFEMSSAAPKILVFDLDYTLWPFRVDIHTKPPFRQNSDGVVVDSSGFKVTPYPQVPDVLSDLHKQDYILAVASRASEIERARQLIDLFGWKKYFSYQEIHPGRKTKHLTKIRNVFGVEFKDIIFFDDEGRNIRDVSDLGIFSILVENGVTQKVVDDAISWFSEVRAVQERQQCET